MKYFMMLPFTILALLVSVPGLAQDTTLTWVSQNGTPVAREKASFLRKLWQEQEGLWQVHDYFPEGGLQMEGTYSSLEPEVKEGLFVYFHENGNKRMEGHYAQNVKVGSWTVWYEDGALSDKGNYEALAAYPSHTLEAALMQPSLPENDTLSMRSGAWEYFYESGHLSSSINWENNEAVALEYFDEDGSIPYEAPVLEMLPQFPGGEHAFMHFLGSNVRYPEADKAAEVSGQVVIQFTVQKDGTVADPKIVKSVSPTIDAECIRLVNSMPDWIPGYQNNRPVSVEYTLPIDFKAKTYPANSKKYRR